jgi:hypothetical protein
MGINNLNLILKQMENIKTIEQQEEVCQFSELNFADIEIYLQEIIDKKKLEKFLKRKEYYFFKKIKFEERELVLSAVKDVFFLKNDKKSEELYFTLSLTEPEIIEEKDGELLMNFNEPFIYFLLSINYRKESRSIDTCIEKKDPNKELPTNMAPVIYQKIFEYIQGRANKDKQSYFHHIDKIPSFSSQEPLTSKQWDDIFLPIIEKGGYKKSTGQIWNKTYYPE